MCNAWKVFIVFFMILKNWKLLKCLTLDCLITANTYLWENNLVQERVRDVRLEAQAAKLYVDVGSTVFLGGCADTRSWKMGWKEIYQYFFLFVLLCIFFRKESSIFRIHTQISF